ncbi:MAG: NADH:ubiquinone reductase (Na(+)-transporting) subunit D [Spirochaetaceae bacterium]|nr:NADH:ubiquinone reductase (Na(+)-transporting) subunit D [Spirochaetaceae bacterium]|tara:strand:- start:18944 stop:19624 length:681 start_codon:yes stop_codon:yes gene_type:complete
MSAATETKTAAPARPKQPLFGKQEREAIKDPLWDNNPITIQVLGICSALAVTTQMQASLVMGLSVVAVLTSSNLIVSLLRNLIPGKIRIIVQLAVVASLVILVDQILKAYMFEMSKQLSVFVGLIITNCIILGRAEGFAMANKPLPSIMDGLGNAFGYAAILLIVALFREVLGNGSFFGLRVIPEAMYELGYKNIGLMILPPGAFLILGLLIWVQRSVSGKYEANR